MKWAFSSTMAITAIRLQEKTVLSAVELLRRYLSSTPEKLIKKIPNNENVCPLFHDCAADVATYHKSSLAAKIPAMVFASRIWPFLTIWYAI